MANLSPVSVNTRLGAVHLYALETYSSQMEGYELERLDSVKWYITHHDGERWTVFHLSIKPRDRWRPTHWALCRHETAEIENLDDRTFLSVKLGNAVPLESVQAAISYVVVPAADDFMTQDDRDTVTLDWAGRAASAVHMAITNTRVHDIQPWTDAFLSNWINAIDRFYFKQSAVYFNGWPLPHPRVRAEADGSTLTEYLNDDGVVVDWDRTTPYTGA